MRAISAPRWQRVSISSRAISPLCADAVDDGPEPFREARLEAGMGEHEPQGLGQAAVDRLEVALEGQIVGQIELADAGRVAAAAEVLQQQRVIKLPDLELAQADCLPDMDADPAATDAMSRRLALHQIERVTERAQQLGEPDLLHPGALNRAGHCKSAGHCYMEPVAGR